MGLSNLMHYRHPTLGPRTPARLALVGLAAVLLMLALCCGARAGEVVARIPAVLVIERDDDGTTRTRVELMLANVPQPPSEPAPVPPKPKPTPQAPDSIGDAVERALESIPRDFRGRVLEVMADEVAYALNSAGQLQSPDHAARLIASRAIYALDEAGTSLAGQIGMLADAVHAAPEGMPVAERLGALAGVIEAKRLPPQ